MGRGLLGELEPREAQDLIRALLAMANPAARRREAAGKSLIVPPPINRRARARSDAAVRRSSLGHCTTANRGPGPRRCFPSAIPKRRRALKYLADRAGPNMETVIQLVERQPPSMFTAARPFPMA